MTSLLRHEKHYKTHSPPPPRRPQASLGLKQPAGCTSPGVRAAWEASLRTSTVTLKAFREALRDAGLSLTRRRVSDGFAGLLLI